jgi:hypothetical protein
MRQSVRMEYLPVGLPVAPLGGFGPGYKVSIAVGLKPMRPAKCWTAVTIKKNQLVDDACAGVCIYVLNDLIKNDFIIITYNNGGAQWLSGWCVSSQKLSKVGNDQSYDGWSKFIILSSSVLRKAR